MSTTPAPSSSVQSRSPLLHAYHDPLAGIKTHSACVKLADLNCDGDNKLCVCDYDKKMRIYSGTNMITEYALLDTPVALCVTYMEASTPRIPSLAVAAGSYVFIYRQLRPYRKWTCPPVDLPPIEVDIWNELKADALSPQSAIKRLGDARDSGVHLSTRSAELLSLPSEAEKVAFIAEMREVAYQQPTLITCMEVLKKESEESDALCLLVVGTEAGQLLILPQDPVNSNVLCKVQLPSPPALLSVQGSFEVEWRVQVVCRDCRLYTVKNGDVRGSALLVANALDLPAPPVALCRVEKALWIGGMDRGVHCYSARGKRLKGMVVGGEIGEMAVMTLRRAKLSYLLLIYVQGAGGGGGGIGGEICMYRDCSLLHSFQIDPPLWGMVYGGYGREEHSLILIHGGGAGGGVGGNGSGGGGLTIKIWRRTAEIDSLNFTAGPPPEQDIPLSVPKKTKLYLDQTGREREKGGEMHRAFQRDLCKLRLTTARAYVKTLTEGGMSSSSLSSQDLRLQVSVQGLGPKFLLLFSLLNSSPSPLLELRLVITYDPLSYAMGFEERSRQSIPIPVLLPGPKQVVESTVLCIDPQGRRGQLLCLLYAGGDANLSSAPLLSATVKMPLSEPDVF